MSAVSSPPPKVHKRAYQACIPCRERRVKCDLGSVDAPRSGPCGRCRRERKNCTFSVTRGKKKAAALAAVAAASVGPNAQARETAAASLAHVDPSVNVVNPRRHASLPGPFVDYDAANTLPVPGIRPATGVGARPRPGLVPGGLHSRLNSMDAVRPFSPASRSSGENASSTLLKDAAYTTHDALSLLWEAGRQSEKVRADELEALRSSRSSVAIETPELMPAVPRTITTEEALQVWSKLRFVRSGLFTAAEALEMVNYFHTNLAPFTPISSSPFQDPATHEMLLDEEPILAATILMLASRYMKFSGRGAVSRGYVVHEQLWRYLQDMISRMIFGQEQFKAAHMPDNDSSVPHLHDTIGSSVHLGGLRTLGTCEALLLLSEWHPRALHVPAFGDGDSLLVRDDERKTRAMTALGKVQIDWLEPAWRSDRMCWSMLGNALSLAVELGIFDEYDNTMLGAREARKDIWSSDTLRQRAYRVQNLLWVYLTQTAGRLGWKNLTSVSLMNHEGSRNHGDTIRCWVTVASLMKRGNEFLFQSRERTREIIRSGEYLRFLEMLNPLLTEWQRDFERAKLSSPMRSILSIEYSYVRVYVNSVALQAVVEHRDRNADPDHAMPVSTMLNPYEDNKEYFMQVVTAAREILQTVVDELLPNDSLKHVPIRTYSRIVAGAMFCLKSVALSADDEENAISLTLVERTAQALCSCVVDDVHLSIRFGELLHALVLTIRAESSAPHTDENKTQPQTQTQQAANLRSSNVGQPGLQSQIPGVGYANSPIGENGVAAGSLSMPSGIESYERSSMPHANTGSGNVSLSSATVPASASATAAVGPRADGAGGPPSDIGPGTGSSFDRRRADLQSRSFQDSSMPKSHHPHSQSQPPFQQMYNDTSSAPHGSSTGVPLSSAGGMMNQMPGSHQTHNSTTAMQPDAKIKEEYTRKSKPNAPTRARAVTTSAQPYPSITATRVTAMPPSGARRVSMISQPSLESKPRFDESKVNGYFGPQSTGQQLSMTTQPPISAEMNMLSLSTPNTEVSPPYPPYNSAVQPPHRASFAPPYGTPQSRPQGSSANSSVSSPERFNNGQELWFLPGVTQAGAGIASTVPTPGGFAQDMLLGLNNNNANNGENTRQVPVQGRPPDLPMSDIDWPQQQSEWDKLFPPDVSNGDMNMSLLTTEAAPSTQYNNDPDVMFGTTAEYPQYNYPYMQPNMQQQQGQS
ncbi:proline dehydrogenase [Ascosphaera pollenicola]|nr:proline dehydrogenase [Ascosphaera pollenicola]